MVFKIEGEKIEISFFNRKRLQHPQRPSLKISAICSWSSLGINILIGFFLTPFIIKHLGKTGYSIWILIVSFVGCYSLLSVGITSAITRFAARYIGQGDDKGLDETASTAMAFFGFVGALTIVVAFFLAEPLAVFFEVSPEHFNEFRYAIWILGLATGLGCLKSVLGAIIIAHERFVAINFAEILHTLLRAFLIVTMLRRGKGLVGVAAADLIATTFGLGTNFLIFRFFTPVVRISFGVVNWRVLRMLLSYGSIAMIITIAEIMRFNLDNSVIGKMGGLPIVGVYGVAALLIRYMKRLVVAGMSIVNPRFAKLDAEGNQTELRQIFLRSLFVSTFLSCFVTMFAFIFGGRFIIFWVGKDFVGAIPVVWILATAYAIDLSQCTGIGLMYALNKHRCYAVMVVIEGVVNLAISILLFPRYGILGVALGTAIPMCLVKFVQVFYIVHIAHISIRDYVKQVIIPFTVGIIIVVVAWHIGIVTSWEEYSVYQSLAEAVVIGTLFASTVLAIANWIDLPPMVRIRGLRLKFLLSRHTGQKQ